MRRGAAALVVVALWACTRSPQPSLAGAPLEASEPAVAPDAAVTPAPEELPPGGLACLARHYRGQPDKDASGWALVLNEGGARLTWDDGRVKSPPERIAAPDLEDMLASPYPRGPMVPVETEDQDPGRARVEALFRATYGATPADVERALVPVVLRGQTVRVHRAAAEPLSRVARRIDAAVAKSPELARFFRALGGTYNPRRIAGTDRTSAHAWGIALDLDPALGDYWRNARPPRWSNRVPQAIVDAFEAEGFAWGGRWYHYDTMHFELRPELFDPECRTSAFADTVVR